MWPRAVEVMLGLWLVVSPWIFGHWPAPPSGSDLVAGWLVVVLALLSFWTPARRAHLGILAVAVWVAAYGYFAFPHPAAPGAQNDILVGLTLLVFAIIPSDANQPPLAWRRFYEEKARQERVKRAAPR
ncbi:MAG TPA: SPW repeat protein [Thermoanaerobaculia bacterium]|nr:SPW repeat protein [Thermoanaerobaculia bacterium]